MKNTEWTQKCAANIIKLTHTSRLHAHTGTYTRMRPIDSPTGQIIGNLVFGFDCKNLSYFAVYLISFFCVQFRLLSGSVQLPAKRHSHLEFMYSRARAPPDVRRLIANGEADCANNKKKKGENMNKNFPIAKIRNSHAHTVHSARRNGVNQTRKRICGVCAFFFFLFFLGAHRWLNCYARHAPSVPRRCLGYDAISVSMTLNEIANKMCSCITPFLGDAH